MRKLLLTALSLLMLVCATACGADAPPAVEKTPDAVVEQDDFEIISTKYTYKENNVSVVQVKNKSTQAYTVTLNGEYLNADGKVLKKESKTFEGFAGEWKNYFIFNPGIAYDKLNVTIEKTEYTKTAWAGGVFMDYSCTDTGYRVIQSYADSAGNVYFAPENDDVKLCCCVYVYLKTKNMRYEGNGFLDLTQSIIVIDSNGEVVNIRKPYTEVGITKSPGGDEGWSSVVLYGTPYSWKDRDKVKIPDNLKNVTMYTSVISVVERLG